MKRFVSWAAVSSLPQAKKVSLEDQLAVNRAHIEKWGGVLVAELVVPGQSRNIVLFEDACRKIDAYQRLRELIDQKAFDVFIYMDRGRLGRKATLSMAVTELCYEAGILCYETENPPQRLEFERNYDDLILGAFKSVGYQNEVIKTQTRRKAGMVERIRRGGFPAAVPYGWTAKYAEDGSRRIEINEQQAAAVRLALVELYLGRGLGSIQICQELDRRGVPPPRGGRWATSGISSLLRLLPRYAGWTELNRDSGEPYIKARGDWPPILTDDEAEAVAAERRTRAKARRSVASGLLLSRVVWCRACQRPMPLEATTQPAKGRLYPYARCRHCACGKKVVRLSKVEAALRTAVEFLLDESNRRQALSLVPARADTVLAEIARLQADLDRLRGGQSRADEAYTLGYMDADRYYRQIERLRDQTAATEAEIAKLRAALDEERFNEKRPERIQDIVENGMKMLAQTDKAAANAWLRRHFRVWVENGEVVEVEYL